MQRLTLSSSVAQAALAFHALWSPAYGADQLPDVTVRAAVESEGSADGAAALAPAKVIDLGAPGAATALDQQLVEQGWATWDAANSLGLAQGLQMRGFALSNQGVSQLQASRVLLNGHADIAWRFSRDPASLESAQLLGGHDATLLGAGTPGGALLLTSKTPTGTPFFKTQLSMGQEAGLRAVLDGERHVGPLQLRAVLAAQQGGHTPEGVGNEREAALLSTRLPLAGGGHLQWDMEAHRNRMPFPFGTAYVDGRFWLEHAYVDTDRARADRRAWRQALYLERPLGGGVTLKGHAQSAHTRRDETLVGFWGGKPPDQLQGYLRQIDETYRQRDFGLQLDGRFVNNGWRHHWTLAGGSHLQRRNFSGPQNFSASTGFALDLADPRFPADLASIPLSPRFAFERLHDSGLGLAWRADNGTWDWRGGLRSSRLDIEASDLPTKPLATVSRAHPFTHALGVGRKLGAAGRIWAARTQSYLPNRGQLADGSWLPASNATQWELGWAWPADDVAPAPGRPRFAAAAFDIRRSNLAATDPANPDYYILRGAQRSRGLELQAAISTGVLRWTLAATWQHARVSEVSSAGQGTYLPGVPDRFGSLHVQAPVHGTGSADVQAWARLTASGSRPGDALASFRAPGWGVMDAGLRGRWPGQRQIQWGLSVSNLANRRYVRALTNADNVWQGPLRRWQLWLDAAF